MGININKIDNLLIDEGTADNPFILSDREVTTLYKLAVSNNPKISIKGYVNTVSGTILKYQAYTIKNAWPELVILARETTSQNWTVSLLTSSINEGGETTLMATNIALETLEFRVRSVSCDHRSPEEIIPLIHFDRTTGRIYFDKPTSNLGWLATIILEFWPSYIESPAAEDYRTVQLSVRAIAVDDVIITAPSRIDESSITSIYLSASPAGNTKGDNCKFRLRTTYGSITPNEITATKQFDYFAPSFVDITNAGGTVDSDDDGPYFNHGFVAEYYMFGVTEPSGINTKTIKMQNATFAVTCDRDSLVECPGESGRDNSAHFSTIGYEWAECQKTMVVNEASLIGITKEELETRVMFETAPRFTMNPPIDNATFSADVVLHIAPPGADPIGDRAFHFPMHLSAVGITSLTLSPRIVGQAITSIITLEYRPLIHTKGNVSFSLVCSTLGFDDSDDIHGRYQITSTVIADHIAIASIYSEYIGTSMPLLSTENTIYVQNTRFYIGYNPTYTIQSASIFEGGSIDCYCSSLHISEVKRNISVTITKGADLIDENWVINRLHFSDDITTDRIWFDAPHENISWKATIKMTLIAKYIPDDMPEEQIPWKQTLYLECEAIEATGVEWQDFATGDNYRIATTPYSIETLIPKYFVLKSVPYNNTKQAVLETLRTSPFSIDAPGTGLSLTTDNSKGKGVYASMALSHGDWILHGYLAAFATDEDYGTVSKNISGKTTQEGTPSPFNISYPKNLTLVTERNQNKYELCGIDELYNDTYTITTGELEVTREIVRKVGKKVLDNNTIPYQVGEISNNSVWFSIQVAGKNDTVGRNKVICSHFKTVNEDITLENSEINSIINGSQNEQIIIRIGLNVIGATATDTTDTLSDKIRLYIADQFNNNTPITIYYPLAYQSEAEEITDTLYYDNIFFTAPLYHLFSANNPANHCSIDFINNSTTALEAEGTTSRIIFGTAYPVSSGANKQLEDLTISRIRPDTQEDTEETRVKFFSGTPTSIEQYDNLGNLLLDKNGNIEYGKVNIWENFSGKYEEWTEETTPTQVTYDITGTTTRVVAPSYDAERNVIIPAVYMHKFEYSDDLCTTKAEFGGYTWDGTWYGDRYDAQNERVISTWAKQELTGSTTIYFYQNYPTMAAMLFYPAGPNGEAFKAIGSSKAYFLCSHCETMTGWHLSNVNYPTHCSNSGTGNIIYLQMPHALLGTSSSSTNQNIVDAFKTYFAAQKAAGTPVTFYFPIRESFSSSATKKFYTKGITHHKYTISKIINDDDTKYDANGQVIKQNTFNKAFVFNKDGSIPSRFFLPRFIPGWNQDDASTTLSLASGLKSQPRTLTSEAVDDQGCYYKNDKGELQKVDKLYYGPLLAYTWLAYLTYGTLNLKNEIGLGASRLGAEAKIFADSSGSPLEPGTAYNTVWILNNGFISDTSYNRYDFNILGITDPDYIGTEPITTYKILTISKGDTYTSISLGNAAGEVASYTAKYATEYYSLNSCFSESGYSERKYLDNTDNVVISGYGNNTILNDSLHPVRCLNIENMWGGGDYLIHGTGFVADENDNTIVHPVLWNPEDIENQDLDDSNTWEVETDLNVVQANGTWDIGSFKYKGAKCGWPEKAAGEKIPYRGYNVYNRPATLIPHLYSWDTGACSEWSLGSDYPAMCGLGHTELIRNNSSSTLIKTAEASYQVIEYIEGTGSQTIDTGIKGSYKFVHDIQFTDTNANTRKLMGHTGSNPYWGQNNINNYEISGTNTGVHIGNREIVTYDVTIPNAAYLIVQGKSTRGGAIANFSSYSYKIFGNIISSVPAKLFSLKIYNADGALLYNMLPVRRISDDKPGLFDLINQSFYTATTGTITSFGNDVAEIADEEQRYYINKFLAVDSANNSQYINSGIKLSQDTKIVIDFESDHTSSENSYFGGTIGTSNSGLNLFISTTNRLCYDNNGSIINLTAENTIRARKRHLIEVEQTNSNLIAKLDNIQTYSGIGYTLDTTLDYGLFAISTSTMPDYTRSFRGRIYSYKIYKQNKLVRDFIPVYDNKTRTVGLYDNIGKKYYELPNAILDISTPKTNYLKNIPLKPVNSIQFNSGDYIDTQWIYEPGASVKITAQKAVVGNSIIFGNEEPNNKFTLSIANTNNYPSVDIGTTTSALTATTTVNKYYTINLNTDNTNYNLLVKGNNINSLTTTDLNTSTKQQNSCFLGSYRGESGTIGDATLTNRIYDCILTGVEASPLYTQLDYIEMTGTQYIDTTLTSSSRLKVVHDIEFTSSDRNLMGFSVSGQNFWGTANTSQYEFYGQLLSLPTNVRRIITYDWTSTTNTSLIIDGQVLTAAAIDASNNYYIGKINGSAEYYSRCKIYGVKIYDINDTLTADLIPCYRKSDFEIGLYDKINDIFYTNNGTGTFKSGRETILNKHFTPVINLYTKTYGMYELNEGVFYSNYGGGNFSTGGTELQKVAYIQNPNNATFNNWSIDTEIKFKDTSKIVVDLDVVSNSVDGHNRCIIGTINSNTNPSTYSYLCYTDDVTEGVTLIGRQVEGSKVSWEYTYSLINDATIHISSGVTATAAGTYNYKHVTIYGLDGTTVLRDLTPCNGGFYDSVSGQMLGNQNTATSIYGPSASDQVRDDPGLFFTKVKLLARVFGTL